MKYMWHNSQTAASKDFLWATLNQVVLSLGAIAIIVVLSNVLAAHTFGEARFLTAVLAVFAFFSLPGIGPVVLQQMPIYSYKGFRDAIVTQGKWGIGASGGAFLLALVFYFQGNVDLATAFVVSGILAPVANLYLMPGTALAGLHKFSHKAWYDGVIIFSVVLGTWYGASTTGTVAGTMLWYYGTQSLVTLVALYFVKQHLTAVETTRYDLAADTKFGKQLTLFQLPFTLLPALEKVLVFVFLGPVALAVYIIAFLPIEHIRNAYRNILQFFILPKLQPGARSSDDLRHWLLVAAILSVGSIVAIILFAYWVLPFVFPEYTEVQALMLLSAIIPLALPGYLYVLKILSERRTERLYAYAMVTVVIDLLTFTILTSLFALPGAVAAKIATSFFAALVAYVLYKSDGSAEIRGRG